MATSGLFLSDRDKIEVIPYDRNAIEAVAGRYHAACGAAARTPEPFMVNDPPMVTTSDQENGEAVVARGSRHVVV